MNKSTLAHLCAAMTLVFASVSAGAAVYEVSFSTTIERDWRATGVPAYRTSTAEGSFVFDSEQLALTGSGLVGMPTLYLSSQVFWDGEDVTALHLLNEGLPATPTDWSFIVDGFGVEAGSGKPIFHVLARDVDPGNRIYKPAVSPLSPPRALRSLSISIGGPLSTAVWEHDLNVNQSGVAVQWTVTTVPEPAALSMFGLGLLCVVVSVVGRGRAAMSVI